MKTLCVAAVLALLTALLIAGLHQPRPLETQLMRLQVQQALPEMASELDGESAALQALFLSYANDPVLLAKARVARLRYPEMAPPILLDFGDNPSFQDVLRRYGEDVLLPIHYFLHNDVFTLELMRGFNETARSSLGALRRLWGERAPLQDRAASGALTGEERAWYAIHFIAAEGYDFLGQFVMNARGQVAWIQTERVLEGINQFFASGIRGLETKIRRDETVGAGDIGWAALDVAIGVSAFKLLRVGKAGAMGARSMNFSQRSAALGAGLWRGTVIGTRLVKYGAPAVLAYVAIRHPSVINSLLGSAAERLGLPVPLAQVLGWTLVLLPVLLVLRWLIGPLAWLMMGLARSLAWTHRRLSGRRQVWR